MVEINSNVVIRNNTIHQRAIEAAIAYRRKHGEPVDRLLGLLGRSPRAAAVWRKIVDEPYGRRALD